MNSYSILQKNIAKLSIISIIALISPLSVVNAATGTINVVTEVPTPTNNITPEYTFNSDSTGSIAYTGPCSSALTTLVSTGNTTITLNSLPEGTYSTCTIQVNNDEGSSNILTLAAFTIDTTPPVVTLSGTSIETIAQGSIYTDSGATWIDLIDGSGIILTATTGVIDTSSIGSGILTYSHTDNAGNTGSATRTINITDQTAPEVHLSGSTSIIIFSGSTYIDLGADWVDNVDGIGDTLVGTYGDTGSFQSSGSVNTSQTGTYTLSYLKVDAAGNTGSATRTVTVIEQDFIAPVVNLSGSSSITVAQGSIYTDLGADWIDTIDGTGDTLIGTYGDAGSFQSSGSVNTEIIGVYTIEYLKVDTSGNTGSATRTINITDQTAPEVHLSGSTNINIIQSGSYNELGATWVDNVDGTGDILASTSGSVNTFIVGVYILTYSHIDAAGNTGSVTRKVVVHVPDITNPEVSLIGSGNMIVYSDSIYTDPGASWTDNIDGTGNTLVGIYGNTGSFQSTGTLINGVQSQTGVYTLTYLKVDAAGNTGSATRTVTVIGSITLSGAVSGTDSVVVSSGSVQPGTLVITNGNSINVTSLSGSLNIPGTVNFLLSGSVWNGILYAPVISIGSTLDIGDAGVVTNLPQDTPTTDYSYTVLPTYMAGGTGGTSLIASGGVFTLSMQVNSPSVSSGTTLPIFRSTDSIIWTLNSPQSSCTLDSALMCTFTTDHLSYFGFVRVTSTPITVVTTPTTITSGPGGGISYGSSPTMVNIPMLSAPSSTNTSMVVDTITKDSPTTSNSLFDNIFGDTTNNSSIDDSLFNDLFGDTTNNSGIDNSNTSIDNSNTTNNNTPAIIGTAYISVKNSLRVRAGTSFNTTIVAYIYRNQEIEVLDTNIPNWSHIQFRTAKGTIREGYILSYYVREMTNIDKIRNGAITFAEATVTMPEITGYINVAQSLNLRSGPSIYTRVKTVLKPNTKVIILDAIGKWREIMTERYHGYVPSKYIKQY